MTGSEGEAYGNILSTLKNVHVCVRDTGTIPLHHESAETIVDCPSLLNYKLLYGKDNVPYSSFQIC